jgi:hypothetical protein
MNAFYEHHRDSIRFGYRCFDRRSIVHGSAGAIGSTRLGSLFLTLPTRLLTGQHTIPADGVTASTSRSVPSPEPA